MAILHPSKSIFDLNKEMATFSFYSNMALRGDCSYIILFCHLGKQCNYQLVHCNIQLNNNKIAKDSNYISFIKNRSFS